jgi:hypothetical protein
MASVDTGRMDLLHDALRAGRAAPPSTQAALRGVLVAGGGGVLGAAVLEQLLASRAFAPVSVLVTQPLNTALRGLVAVPQAVLDSAAAPTLPPQAVALAIIVFDRARHANGRERAFMRPEPQDLQGLASRLRAHGVANLVIVMPHAPASLPDALKRGLANLDEQAVASLGFERVVLVRSAQAGAAKDGPGGTLQKLADAVLSQLRVMVPQHERAVRAVKVAQFTIALATWLHEMPHGTRVVPPEALWLAAQRQDPTALVRDILQGRPLPQLQHHATRM